MLTIAMKNTETYYATLKTLLKTGWQRQDSALQQLMDVQPVLHAAGLDDIELYIATLALGPHRLIDSGVYAQEAASIAAVELPPGMSFAEKKRVAIDMANLLGCYDAADALKSIPLPTVENKPEGERHES